MAVVSSPFSFHGYRLGQISGEVNLKQQKVAAQVSATHCVVKPALKVLYNRKMNIPGHLQP